MKRFKEENLEECINKQFEINWYDIKFDKVKWQDNWFSKHITTKEKEEEFKQWLIKYLKPFVISFRLEKEANKFILNYWLKISNE